MLCECCGNRRDSRARWCVACEATFDQWVRRYAADIAWSVLSGGCVLAMVGLLLPVIGIGLGIGWGMGPAAVFLGWGTVLASYKLIRRRRRHQFLAGTALPRAYLASP